MNRYNDINTGGVEHVSKKKIFNVIFVLILVLIIFAFLWPRSFLRSIDTEINSISVVVIENTLKHEQTEYTFTCIPNQIAMASYIQFHLVEPVNLFSTMEYIAWAIGAIKPI